MTTLHMRHKHVKHATQLGGIESNFRPWLPTFHLRYLPVLNLMYEQIKNRTFS